MDELGRDHVRARVRRFLGGTSDEQDSTGVYAGRDVTFSYSGDDAEPANTYVKVDLGSPGQFRMRLWNREPRRGDSCVCYGFSGTATPPAVAVCLMDRAACGLLAESNVASITIDTFDPKDYLPRRTARKIDKLPEPAREPYRTRYHLTLVIRGWIEDPDRAVTAITLAVDIASRIADAYTRAAAEDAPRDGAPYRDLPTDTSPSRHASHGSYVLKLWAMFYRFRLLIVLALLATLFAVLWSR